MAKDWDKKESKCDLEHPVLRAVELNVLQKWWIFSYSSVGLKYRPIPDHQAPEPLEAFEAKSFGNAHANPTDTCYLPIKCHTVDT